MKILNFDTSLDKTYITLSADNVILKSRIIENQKEKYHSAFLIPEIAKILREFNLFISDLDYISTNVGPGSFTGIRAGLTVARTLCQQGNIKAVGFTSLEILSKINKTPEKSIVLLDARKDMAYVEILSSDGQIIERPSAKLLEEIINILNRDEYCVICDDKISDILANHEINHINYKLNNYDLGLFLNELTNDFVLKNKETDYNWAKLKPLYIQPPPVSIKK